MSEHPILFSGEMVRAILEGRKTQTRRVLNPRPFLEKSDKGEWWCLDRSRNGYGKTNSCWRVGGEPFWTYCPFGDCGDRLWVRETWAMNEPPSGAIYRADAEAHNGFPAKWKPSIFMPRQYSRISLEIAKIKVQRLQEISNEDARAEGVYACPHRGATCGLFETGFNQCFGCAYRVLWNQINGPRGFGWDTNPWVWVIEFKVSGAAGGNRQEPHK